MNYKDALARGKEQLERAQGLSWGGTEEEIDECRGEVVTWTFYAIENAVIAVAIKLNIPWEKTHTSKVYIAGQLYSKGFVSVDVSDLLKELNMARKDVAYGESGSSLTSIDLEDLLGTAEDFIEQVEKICQS